MKFSKTSLGGLWLIDLELREDERGFLARTYCQNEFAEHGLNTQWPQCNLTLTRKKGMLRRRHLRCAGRCPPGFPHLRKMGRFRSDCAKSSHSLCARWVRPRLSVSDR